MKGCLSEIGQIIENVLDAADAEMETLVTRRQQEGKAHKMTMGAKAMETIFVSG